MKTEFERRAVALQLKKMFTDTHFSICTVDSCMRALQIMPNEDYKALSLLHCVHWKDMGEDMRREVMRRTLRLLSQADTSEMIDVALGLQESPALLKTIQVIAEEQTRPAPRDEPKPESAAMQVERGFFARWLGV